MKNTKIAVDRITQCEIIGESLEASTFFERKIVACGDAYLSDVNCTGASFQGMSFSNGGGLSLSDVNLTGTKWRGAKTSKIKFQDVDLTGADITLNQLAEAVVSQDSTLPDGITYRDILERRAFLKIDPAGGAEPNL